MLNKLLAGVALSVAVSGSAFATNVPERQAARCRVVAGEKLSVESGGSNALCAAIERAIAARAPGVPYSVEIRILSASRLSAILTTGDGRRMPELQQASMDRKLGRSSFERFAEALASQLARGVPR